jgi:hypothetical protein
MGSKPEEARRLARMLITPADEQVCERCLDLLEAYVEYQLGDNAAFAEAAWVANHLDSCVACAEAYALLYEVRVAPPVLSDLRVPVPNMAFLASGTANSLTPEQLREQRRQATWGALLSAALQRVAERWQVQLSQALLDLAPRPTALALRGSTAPLLQFVLEPTDPQLQSLTVSAYATSQPDLVDLRVQLAFVDREWPDLEGIAVQIFYADQRRDASSDAWGEVVFSGVPQAEIANLRFEFSG